MIVYSWYPRNLSDDTIASFPGYVDSLVGLYLTAAHRYGLKITFLLEPYKTARGEKRATDFSQDIAYIMRMYGGHPAFYRFLSSHIQTFSSAFLRMVC
jgi:hypothetical protein